MFVHRSAVDTHYGSDALLPGSFLYRAVRLGAGVPSVVRPCVDTIWLRGDLECLQHQCLYSFRLVFGDFDRLPHLALVQQVLGGEIREGRNSLFRLSLISSERFWEGTTLVYKMTGHLNDMTHVVMGFSRYGKADKEKVDTFNHTFVRLVSLLHAVILAELEGDDLGTASKALEYELLDVQGLCSRTLTHIRRVSAVHRDHLPIMVFQWMHNLIVDNMTTEVLSIPAPLLTRVFGAMTESMLNYHEARKYADTPFPFPYTAGIEIVLSVHFILTPLFVALWTRSPFALCLFTFVLLFPMWLLHLVPNEMENPFVPDYNGLNTKELQEELNKVLAALLSDSFSHCPELRVLAADAGERLGWNELLSLSEQETPMPQR